MAENPFIKFAPPGHFYSPLPDLEFVERHKATLFDCRRKDIPGIDMRAENQLALLEKFAAYYEELPFKDEQSPGLCYYFLNHYFSYGDAIVLYSMPRHGRPGESWRSGQVFHRQSCSIRTIAFARTRSR